MFLRQPNNRITISAAASNHLHNCARGREENVSYYNGIMRSNVWHYNSIMQTGMRRFTPIIAACLSRCYFNHNIRYLTRKCEANEQACYLKQFKHKQTGFPLQMRGSLHFMRTLHKLTQNCTLFATISAFNAVQARDEHAKQTHCQKTEYCVFLQVH